MADRSNLKKFLENDSYGPDDFLHENVLDNNNDIDAVDLNYNNNNNNETYCSEVQCLSRNGRQSRSAKTSEARASPATQNFLEENQESYSYSEATDQGFHSLNVEDRYPKFESINSAPGVQTFQNHNRKPSNEDFFCSETRNFLSIDSLARDSPPSQQTEGGAENWPDHYHCYGDYSKKAGPGENSFLFHDSENTLDERKKGRSAEMSGFCSVGIVASDRGSKESISTKPKSKKPFLSRSRYLTGGSYNSDPRTQGLRTKTDSVLTGGLFGKCGEFPSDNQAQGSTKFSNPRSRSNSEKFSSNFTETETPDFLSRGRVENYGESTMDSAEMDSIGLQTTSSLKVSPRGRRPELTRKFPTDQCSETYSCSFSENDCSSFPGTEGIFPSFDGRRATDTGDSERTEIDFSSFGRRVKDSCDFGGNFGLSPKNPCDFGRKDRNCPPCSSGENCGFQGDFEAFECESCMHCSSETLSSSSYSDCGPDCECRGGHSVSPEWRDPGTQVPEVRWTARLLGGDEQEVEAFKAKKIASMKK